jgi:hypothetical protein
MRCKRCGAMNPAGARFCGACGASLGRRQGIWPLVLTLSVAVSSVIGVCGVLAGAVGVGMVVLGRGLRGDTEPAGLAGKVVPSPSREPTPTETPEVWAEPVASPRRGRVGRIAFSPDGRWLAVGSSRGVNVYEAATLRGARRFGTGGEVLNVAFSPDGRLLAAGSEDNRVILWDLETGERVKTVENNALAEILLRLTIGGNLPRNLLSVVFSPDGRLVTTWSEAGSTMWLVPFVVPVPGPGVPPVVVWQDVKTEGDTRTLARGA